MSGFGSAIALGPGEGRAFSIGGDRVVVKGSTQQGSDGFSVVEYVGAANGPGPPMHVHRTFEECWFILDGAVELHVDGESRVASFGSFLLVPRGVAHTFRVAGPVPARWVGIFSPARYMGLIEELGALIPADRPPDPEKVAALFARYDTDITGPPAQ